MSDPMPVMTRIINVDSWSSLSANGTCRVPDETQLKTTWSTARPPWKRIGQADATETTNAPIIARQARPPETDFDSLRPKKAFTTKPDEGQERNQEQHVTT